MPRGTQRTARKAGKKDEDELVSGFHGGDFTLTAPAQFLLLLHERENRRAHCHDSLRAPEPR